MLFAKNLGKSLSQQGVTLARKIGETMGNFNRVITSPVPRAFQTALAMGYAVNATEELLSTYGEAVEIECPYPASFADYAAAYHLSRKGVFLYANQFSWS